MATSKFKNLHPLASVVYSMPAIAAVSGGMQVPALNTTVGTVSGGIREITAERKREPDGERVVMALRHYTGDDTVVKPGAFASLTWLGESRTLLVDRRIRRYPGPPFHQEIDLVDTVDSLRGRWE